MQVGHQFKYMNEGAQPGGTVTELRDDYIKIENSPIDVDADGANGQFGKEPAYAPDGWGKTLDTIADGGWSGVVGGEDNPAIQGDSDPCPGAYVSPTSLRLKKPDGSFFEERDPMGYVDAASVPFLVICGEVLDSVPGIIFGCRAVLTNQSTKEKVEAVCGDGGNSNEMGEISYAAAQALGIKGASPLSIPDDAPLITMEIYPGTAAVVDGVTYPLQSS